MEYLAAKCHIIGRSEAQYHASANSGTSSRVLTKSCVKVWVTETKCINWIETFSMTKIAKLNIYRVKKFVLPHSTLMLTNKRSLLVLRAKLSLPIISILVCPLAWMPSTLLGLIASLWCTTQLMPRFQVGCIDKTIMNIFSASWTQVFNLFKSFWLCTRKKLYTIFTRNRGSSWSAWSFRWRAWRHGHLSRQQLCRMYVAYIIY